VETLDAPGRRRRPGGKCNFYIEHTDRQLLELIRCRFDFGPHVLERSTRDRDIGKVRKIIRGAGLGI
jgi:hypothetical protein